ncbi:MAG: ribosome assembly cofactor RimP [Bacteroidales bacterium]
MIDKNAVKQLVDTWLEGKDYFLTDLTISTDDRIVVEIDHKDGVWIEDCVALSRFIEDGLNRDEEDFELEVGSAGIGHQGDTVEVLTAEGKKLIGTLADVQPESFTVTVTEKVKEEGKKRPVMKERDVVLNFADVKGTKYYIDFK